MTTTPEPPQTPCAEPAVPATRAQARAQSAHAVQPVTAAPAQPVTEATLGAVPPAGSGSGSVSAQPENPSFVPPTVPVSSGSAFTQPETPLFAPSPAEAPVHAAPAAAPVLDEGTYPALRTPKAQGALALDGSWHQISPKFVVAEVILRVLLLVVIAAGAYAATAFLAQPWPWAWTVAGVFALGILFELVILPRQARAIGYMLRADDIVFRRGILWQRMIAVPYGRMQLVDITRGPVDRAFGIAKLKLVTAAATTGVEIPGMTEDAAEALRDTLIDVAEMRRTGL